MKVNNLVTEEEKRKSRRQVSKELLNIVGIDPVMRTNSLTKEELIAIKQRVKSIKQELEYFKGRYE